MEFTDFVDIMSLCVCACVCVRGVCRFSLGEVSSVVAAATVSCL